MGVTLSKDSTTSPFFLSTGIIGIISFVFTVATLLRVLWTNLMTLGEAPHEVHAYLTNLRTELLEERESLKVMRKMHRRRMRNSEKRGRGGGEGGLVGLDEVTLKTMADTVRHLVRVFREIEGPFLEPGELGIGDNPKRKQRRDQQQQEGQKRRSRKRSSVSPYATSSSPPRRGGGEKSRRRASRNDNDRYSPRPPRYAISDRHLEENNNDEEEEEGSRYWAQRTRYAEYSFWKRMKWISVKPRAQNLFGVLSRVQTRRIALQVGGLAWLVWESGSCAEETRELVRRVEERIGRMG